MTRHKNSTQPTVKTEKPIINCPTVTLRIENHILSWHRVKDTIETAAT
jgi:hypothetical protein